MKRTVNISELFEDDPANCPPLNDVDAWTKYSELRWVYNRMDLAQMQGIPCAPLPVEPDDAVFPVVVKPVINLYGMSLKSSRVSSIHKFYQKHWLNTDFWMQYLDGDHMSFDIVLVNGEIRFHICFRGLKNGKLFDVFDKWVLVKEEVPDVVKQLLANFGDFTGVVNVEMAEDKIVECYLRIANLDQLGDPAIMDNIVSLYKEGQWNYVGKPKKTYIYPIWIKRNYVSPNVVKKFQENLVDIKQEIEELLEDEEHVISYDFEPGSNGNLSKLIRFMTIVVCNAEKGDEVKIKINEILKSYR